MNDERAAPPLTAKQANTLARRVGSLANQIDKENEQHYRKIGVLIEKLDYIYERLGAESLDGS